jgi:hypothetical protein
MNDATDWRLSLEDGAVLTSSSYFLPCFGVVCWAWP